MSRLIQHACKIFKTYLIPPPRAHIIVIIIISIVIIIIIQSFPPEVPILLFICLFFIAPLKYNCNNTYIYFFCPLSLWTLNYSPGGHAKFVNTFSHALSRSFSRYCIHVCNVYTHTHENKKTNYLYIYTVYGAFHAESTRLKPLLFFFFFIEVCYIWPQKKETPIFRFFWKFLWQ